MSQLDNALSQATLMMPTSLAGINVSRPKTRFQIAKRVFDLAASGGFPYTGMTHKQWGKKWLSSDSFKLMEIDINAAASPHLPKNPERVSYRLFCATDSVDPIVVDLNKQKVGKSHLGFIPEVIVVDGKHRKQGQLLQGRTRILAWVGCKAEKRIKNAVVIDKLAFREVPLISHPGSKPAIESMHFGRAHEIPGTIRSIAAAVVPSGGQMIVDQSGGEQGSRPRGAMVKAGKGKCPHCGSNKFKLMPTDFETAKCANCGKNFQMKASAKVGDCNACGPAFSQGSLDDASTSSSGTDYEQEVPNPTNKGTHVPSKDQLKYTAKPNVKAPGAKGWNGQYGTDSMGDQAPGSGVGPRTKRHTGARGSEMSRLADTVKAKGKVIDEIHVKDKTKQKLFTNLNKRG